MRLTRRAAGQIYSNLSGELAAIAGIGQDPVNVNYRLYGDQVSLFGTPTAATITLADPAGITFSTSPNPVGNVMVNVTDFLTLHGILTVTGQIASDAPEVSAAGEPNNAQAIESYIQPTLLNTLLPYNIQINEFLFAATQLIGNLIDPTSGTDFVFQGQAGSPDFASLDLPALSGIATYNVRYESGGVWSAFQQVQPGVPVAFGSNVNGVEFEPVDSNGLPVEITDSFLFGATFGSTGTFAGTLAEGTFASPPSPPTSNPDSYNVPENQVLTANSANGVLSNDTDPNGLPLTATLLTNPAHGSLQLSADGSLTYTPIVNFSGTDSFTYENSDALFDSQPTTVTINVAPGKALSVTWTDATGDGQWTTPGNWNTEAVPTSSDNVVIPASSGPTMGVTISGGSQSVLSLNCAAPFSIGGGSLQVGSGGGNFSDGLALYGGIIQNSSLTFSGGTANPFANLLLQFGTIQNSVLTFSGGSEIVPYLFGTATLDNTTVNGNIDLSQQANGAALDIQDGLALNGTILLGNAAGTTHAILDFVGASPESLATTPGGSASIMLGGAVSNLFGGNQIEANSAVTFGAGGDGPRRQRIFVRQFFFEPVHQRRDHRLRRWRDDHDQFAAFQQWNPGRQ